MGQLLQDLRYGARGLLRNRGFGLVAILTLALGIGANAAIFSVLDAVLIRPLPWADADRVVMIWSRWTAFDKTWMATGEVNGYRGRSRTLSSIAAWSDGQVNLTGDGEPERVAAGQVTANLFATLGVQPYLGRVFSSQEDVPNGPNVVLLGHGLWQRRYAADAAVVGRAIQIDGKPFVVIGIMPRGFVLPTDFENPEPTVLWTPIQWDPASADHGSHGLYAAGRLVPGSTTEQVREELRAIAADWTTQGLYPYAMKYDAVIESVRDAVVGGVSRTIWLLVGAVGFLLLIACANVASLLLARAEARQREIAVRTALGATRGRVLRQLVTESLLLSSVSAGAGLLLAWAGVRSLQALNVSQIPRLAEADVNTRVLLAAAVLAVLTTALFGAAPALRLTRADLQDALKEGSANATAGGRRRRFRDVLVVAQMALAAALLIGAGLMLRSLWALQHVDLGFNPAGVLTMRVALPPSAYASPESVTTFYSRLVSDLHAIPGVSAAGAARSLPLGSTIGDFGLTVDGYVPPAGTGAKGDWQIATDGYLEAMGEQLLAGRGILPSDTSDSQLVALVNEQMARTYWAGRDAIGGRFRIGRNPSRPWIAVVGVVKNVRHNGVAGIVKEKFYVPHTQWHKSVGNPIRAMTLVIRTPGNPAAMARAARGTVARLDPDLPVADVRTMADVVGSSIAAPRLAGALLALFAALALALAGIGIYGVLSFVVSRRTREIGIRVALGAGRGSLLAMVLGSGLALSFCGVALGFGVAAAASRLLRDLLHGVTPADPLTYAAVGGVLTLVSIVASFVPAWRATRVDPLVALKSD